MLGLCDLESSFRNGAAHATMFLLHVKRQLTDQASLIGGQESLNWLCVRVVELLSPSSKTGFVCHCARVAFSLSSPNSSLFMGSNLKDPNLLDHPKSFFK